MFGLLDAVAHAEPNAHVHWLVKLLGGMDANAAALAITIIGGAMGTVAISTYVKWHKAKRELAMLAVPPTPQSPFDVERAAMLARVTQTERETAELRALWRHHDAEEKLKLAIVEMEALRTALTHERAVNTEITRDRNDLRLECAQLRLELDSAATVDDAVTVLDDIGERIPTIPPMPRRAF